MGDVLTDKKYVSVVIEGDTAKRLRELINRGLVSSTKDAVIQGLNLLYGRFLTLDLKAREAKEEIEWANA
jgi:hypothetical protein